MKRQMFVMCALLVGALGAAAQGPGRGQGPARFEVFDANADGVISEAELNEGRNARLQQRAEEGRMMRNVANMPAFAELDRNGDGGISREEFAVHQMEQRQQRMEQRQQSKQ